MIPLDKFVASVKGIEVLNLHNKNLKTAFYGALTSEILDFMGLFRRQRCFTG
jgi:hypothetical protein